MQRLECEIHRRKGGREACRSARLRGLGSQWPPPGGPVMISVRGRGPPHGPSRVSARPGPARRCAAFLGWVASKFGALLYWWCQSLIISDPAAFLLIQRRAPVVPPAVPLDLSIFSARPSFFPPGPVPLPPLAYLKYNVAMLFCHFTIFLGPVLERGGRVCEAPSVTACRVAKLMPTSSLRM